MSLQHSERRFITDYYDVDVPNQFETEYPTKDEVYLKGKDFFNRITASLDIGYLATTALMPEQDRITFGSASTFTRKLWFDELQVLAEFSGQRNGDRTQLVRFSKHRLTPESIAAIIEIHKLGRIIG